MKLPEIPDDDADVTVEGSGDKDHDCRCYVVAQVSFLLCVNLKKRKRLLTNWFKRILPDIIITCN